MARLRGHRVLPETLDHGQEILPLLDCELLFQGSGEMILKGRIRSARTATSMQWILRQVIRCKRDDRRTILLPIRPLQLVPSQQKALGRLDDLLQLVRTANRLARTPVLRQN